MYTLDTSSKKNILEATGMTVEQIIDMDFDLADGRAKYSLDVKYDRKVEIVPSGIPEYLGRLSSQLQNGQSTQQRLSNKESRFSLAWIPLINAEFI